MPFETPAQAEETPAAIEETTTTEPEIVDDEEGESDVSASIAGLKQLFATLVPPTDVRIMDAFGGEHKARALLPARRQVQVVRELEALIDSNIDLGSLASFGDGDDGTAAAIHAIVGVAANEQVLSGLGRAFAIAHPGIMKAALNNALELGLGDEIETDDAADLFPVEEIVAGLLPFFVRLATRLLDALGRVPEAEQLAAKA